MMINVAALFKGNNSACVSLREVNYFSLSLKRALHSDALEAQKGI